MKLITVSDKCKAIAERWKEQYGDFKDDDLYIKKGVLSKRKIYSQLLALHGQGTPEEINEIIGNDSWTAVRCWECNRSDMPVVVELGQEPDYESITTWICKDCLRKAIELIGESRLQTEQKGDEEC